ncbi:MAG: Gfo/Idh/MocA family protein [Lachnospirales bacterium]
MEKVRYGIIGIGTQGSTYAKFLFGDGESSQPELEHCALGGLCDIELKVKEKCEKDFSGIPFYTNWKDMIKSGDVDAVITTVPHYLHTEIGIFALDNKINVLVEKPAGVYGKAVRELNEASKRNPEVGFAIMFNQRTNKLYQKIRELVQSGSMGEIRRSNWIINSWWRPDNYYKQSQWRATWGGEGGGVLVNQAPHQLDLWQWICGTPTKVYGKIIYGAHRDIVVDNDVTVITEYANGATGSFVTCTHDPNGTDRLEIDLDGGKIVVEDSKKATVYRLKKFENELNEKLQMGDLYKLISGNSAEGGLFDVEEIENTDGWGGQHKEVIENFAQHILNGTELLAQGVEGIHGVNLANAMLLSSWLGEEVNYPVDENLYLVELNKKIAEEGKFPQRI